MASEDWQEKFETLKQEFQDFKERTADNEKQLEADLKIATAAEKKKEDEKRKLEAAISDLVSQTEEASQLTERIRSEVAERKRVLESIGGAVDGVEQDTTRLMAERETLQAELTNATEEYEVAVEERTCLEGDIEDLDDFVHRLQSELAQVRSSSLVLHEKIELAAREVGTHSAGQPGPTELMSPRSAGNQMVQSLPAWNLPGKLDAMHDHLSSKLGERVRRAALCRRLREITELVENDRQRAFVSLAQDLDTDLMDHTNNNNKKDEGGDAHVDETNKTADSQSNEVSGEKLGTDNNSLAPSNEAAPAGGIDRNAAQMVRQRAKALWAGMANGPELLKELGHIASMSARESTRESMRESMRESLDERDFTEDGGVNHERAKSHWKTAALKTGKLLQGDQKKKPKIPAMSAVVDQALQKRISDLYAIVLSLTQTQPGPMLPMLPALPVA